MSLVKWLAPWAIVLAIPSEACDYCLISQGISPLQTQNGAGARINQRYTVLDSVYHGTNEIDNPGVKEEYWTTEVSAFYAVTDRLLLLTSVPLRRTEGDGELTEDESGAPAREDVSGEGSGIGDVSLLARYTFAAHHTLESSTLVAGIAGIKLPTGSTDQHGDQGEYLDAHLQPGSGSTDLLLGLSLDHAMGRLSVSANALAAFAGEGETGDSNHEFGDSLNYDVTTRFRLRPDVAGGSANALFASLGINGEARAREHLDGERVADSGGHTIYLTPGVQYVAGGTWIIEATYQHAIYHDLEETQLGEDYRIFAGVTRVF